MHIYRIAYILPCNFVSSPGNRRSSKFLLSRERKFCRETGAKMDVVTRHQYGISASGFRTPFRWETSGGVPKCRLFFQTKSYSLFLFEYEQNEKNTVTYQCDVELQRMKKESEELAKDLADERKAHDMLRSVPRKRFK